ncbi:DUF2165 family protein [Devosia faecipullorum]|uniref:DUF2165 family protein n=1 Tax=Devosia faecipullorum TaxID=2755039 RepID=UPI00187BBAFD|nr:DUF2165 domain-containing protein [Devosia faecipullorum]MBE7733668.1 DUF2165 domain-containing protein [Devosia faecipullorum]
MLVTRVSKIILVAAIALYATLVAFGNVTDYGSNFVFMQHVLSMDTIFPDATISYRAIDNPVLHHAAYMLLIAAQIATALASWGGAGKMFAVRNAAALTFNRSKGWAVAGLTLGFLVWQVGFMTIGGEWFGMWMSSSWNSLQSAFRVFITIVGVLIFVAMPDADIEH